MPCNYTKLFLSLVIIVVIIISHNIDKGLDNELVASSGYTSIIAYNR